MQILTTIGKFFFKTSNQWKGRSGRTGTDSCYRVFTGFNNPSRNPEGQSQELQKTDQVQNISDNQLNGDNESVHQVEREDNRNSDGAKTNSTVSFLGLQETKMESIDLLSVRFCWGSVNFDYVYSDSIGNSGGILCIWDPNSFRKDSVTVSDYFVIVRGVWIKSGMDILIVVVYAPHDVRDKRLLWDYLSHVSNQWAGDQNAHIDMPFPNSLSTDQQKDLEYSWKDLPGDDSYALPVTCVVSFKLLKVMKILSLVCRLQKPIPKVLVLSSRKELGSMDELIEKEDVERAEWDAEQTIINGSSDGFHLDFIRHLFGRTIENDVFEAIKNVKEVYRINGVQLFELYWIKIGNGEITSFWKDKWYLDARRSERCLSPISGVEEFQLDNLSRLVSTITLSSAMVKVNIMAWKIKMDGLPTRMNISRRDSWLEKYRLGGMWITLMFLLMRNGTLCWYLLGFRQISKRCSKASSIVYGGRFGCSVTKILFEKDTPSQCGILITCVSILIIGVSLDVNSLVQRDRFG
ncbi:RNA-directed DNA polymerase, eukaryota [Tanacetum coccineum]